MDAFFVHITEYRSRDFKEEIPANLRNYRHLIEKIGNKDSKQIQKL
jgi:hypothetical protein